MLFQMNGCCYRQLDGTKGPATGGPDQVPAKLRGIRSGSVKICPLITFLTNGLFAAARRSRGDQSGDDTCGIMTGCSRHQECVCVNICHINTRSERRRISAKNPFSLHGAAQPQAAK